MILTNNYVDWSYPVKLQEHTIYNQTGVLLTVWNKRADMYHEIH